MSKIRTLIIDDEPLAREIIKNFLKTNQEVEVIGECGDGFEGFKLINETGPDLVFLDVMMPKLTGFEMLELLEDPPIIIFSTAYDEFAIKAFEQNAVDYLLKPYDKQRFMQAMEKVKASRESKQEERTSLDTIIRNHQEGIEVLTRVAVRTGNKINILAIDKINYLEADDDYVKIHTDEGTFLKPQTMKYYEAHLPADEFLRIHRSYIVQLSQVVKVELMGKDTHVVFLKDGTQLTVSRAGYTKLKTVLGF